MAILQSLVHDTEVSVAPFLLVQRQRSVRLLDALSDGERGPRCFSSGDSEGQVLVCQFRHKSAFVSTVRWRACIADFDSWDGHVHLERHLALGSSLTAFEVTDLAGPARSSRLIDDVCEYLGFKPKTLA